MTGRRMGRAGGLVPAVAVCLLAWAGLSGVALAAPTSHAVQAASGPEFVNVTATSNFGFDPSAFSVSPGSTVHLTFTQAASGTQHTFVLSPVANFTFNASPNFAQFFLAHPPLVNLSLPATAGASVSATFTAPSGGTYEYVCIVQGHYGFGMHGTMTSGAASSGGGGGGSATTLYLVLGVVVIVVIVAIVAVMWMRRPKSPAAPPAPATPPASPPTP